jgi:hypothetical protein
MSKTTCWIRRLVMKWACNIKPPNVTLKHNALTNFGYETQTDICYFSIILSVCPRSCTKRLSSVLTLTYLKSDRKNRNKSTYEVGNTVKIIILPSCRTVNQSQFLITSVLLISILLNPRQWIYLSFIAASSKAVYRIECLQLPTYIHLLCSGQRYKKDTTELATGHIPSQPISEFYYNHEMSGTNSTHET